jgi:exonuclease III
VIDVLAIQETWDYKCKNLVDIPDYHKLISKCREKSRGGGVGFYVHNSLSYKILDSSMYYVEKIYECTIIELVIQKTKYILCNVYRSPSPINGMSLADQHNSFVSKFENMLSNLSDNNVISYVFLDANLNLLNYNTDVNCRQYINAALSNGFYQMITRATRIQGDSYSLIDHIFTNTKNIVPECGVLVSDISIPTLSKKT